MKMLCVGEILVDMIGSGECLEKTDTFRKKPGGAPANVAVAASRMGAEVEIAATVGKDSFGELLVDKMNEEGVGTKNLRRSDLKTTLAFVSLDEEARPDFSFYRGADKDLKAYQLEEGYDIVHLGSLLFTSQKASENIFQYLKSTDATISFDPNLRVELVTPEYLSRIQKVLDYTDIVFLSEDELEKLDTSEVDEVVISRGESGAELKTKEQKIESEPPEVNAVDTTGAGDALTGTYLAFYRKGRNKALNLAVTSAAKSTTSKGAMAALPKKEDIL